MAERASTIRVIQPGLLTTVQDLGRPGWARYGVAPGGALDRAALILGNRLLGNDPGEAGLEITLLGPTLLFTGPAVIAVTGADLGARLNGAALPLWQPVPVRAGDELAFRGAPRVLDDRHRGARAYLCVAGGLAIAPVLGSRSTDLVGRFGGVEGRPLRAGDELSVRALPLPVARILRRTLARQPPAYERTLTARVTLGPQQDRFTEAGIATFLGSEYTVSAKADRQGVRLRGPAIAQTRGADLLSEGIAHGAVQVPGDGQPIVLLAARQTVGGYVKIATVIGADLDRFGQLRPGDTVRFAAVPLAQARAATLAYWAALAADAVVEKSVAPAGWAPVPLVPAADPAVPGPTAEIVVTAPVPGIVYWRGAPAGSQEAPPFVTEGEAVTAGQTIALIEVMKTYHEVTAPCAGVLTALLVEDGQAVDAGQPIARLTPRASDPAG